MAKYPKSKKNIPFDGEKSIRYDSDYYYSKITFEYKDNKLEIIFINTTCPKHKKEYRKRIITINEVTNYTALEIINEYEDKLGRHFRDGILEIWKYLNLDIGYVRKSIRRWL